MNDISNTNIEWTSQSTTQILPDQIAKTYAIISAIGIRHKWGGYWLHSMTMTRKPLTVLQHDEKRKVISLLLFLGAQHTWSCSKSNSRVSLVEGQCLINTLSNSFTLSHLMPKSMMIKSLSSTVWPLRTYLNGSQALLSLKNNTIYYKSLAYLTPHQQMHQAWWWGWKECSSWNVGYKW